MKDRQTSLQIDDPRVKVDGSIKPIFKMRTLSQVNVIFTVWILVSKQKISD